MDGTQFFILTLSKKIKPILSFFLWFAQHPIYKNLILQYPYIPHGILIRWSSYETEREIPRHYFFDPPCTDRNLLYPGVII